MYKVYSSFGFQQGNNIGITSSTCRHCTQGLRNRSCRSCSGRTTFQRSSNQYSYVMFYPVVRSKRTATAQPLRSRPDILRVEVLHCCKLGSIIMRTRLGRSSIDRSACAYNMPSRTDLQQRCSFYLSLYACLAMLKKRPNMHQNRCLSM